jgi:hypothetical protein
MLADGVGLTFGNLRPDFSVDQEAQAQNVVSHRKNDIPVFQSGLKRDGFSSNKAMELAFMDLESPFGGLTSKDLHHPGGRLHISPNLLKSPDSHP